jgi:hypothetical protein
VFINKNSTDWYLVGRRLPCGRDLPHAYGPVLFESIDHNLPRCLGIAYYALARGRERKAVAVLA